MVTRSAARRAAEATDSWRLGGARLPGFGDDVAHTSSDSPEVDDVSDDARRAESRGDRIAVVDTPGGPRTPAAHVRAGVGTGVPVRVSRPGGEIRLPQRRRRGPCGRVAVRRRGRLEEIAVGGRHGRDRSAVGSGCSRHLLERPAPSGSSSSPRKIADAFGALITPWAPAPPRERPPRSWAATWRRRARLRCAAHEAASGGDREADTKSSPPGASCSPARSSGGVRVARRPPRGARGGCARASRSSSCARLYATPAA